MRPLLLMVLVVLAGLGGCEKKDKSIACETDQECTDLIYGKWQQKNVLFSGKRLYYDFLPDSIVIDYMNSHDEMGLIDTSYFYIQSKKVIHFSTYGGSESEHTIKTLNSKLFIWTAGTGEQEFERIK